MNGHCLALTDFFFTGACSLKASSSKFLYDRLMIFSFLGGGATPFITTETKLCQLLISHAKFVTLNKRVGMFVSMTSTSDGGAFLVKHVAFFTRQLRSNISQTFFNGSQLVWRAHIVVEITYDNEVVKINSQFINVSCEVVGERGVCHRLGSVGTHKRPLPATDHSFDDNALNVYDL